VRRAPSLVHPKPIRQLRDLTRYQRTLIREHAREKQRLEKILEDAQIKLSAVVSDLFGVSGRAMTEALIAGQRTPGRWHGWPAAPCATRPGSWKRR
jgi:transposase